MKLDKIMNAEQTLKRVRIKLSGLPVADDVGDDLALIGQLVQEVRHFKVCCDQLAKREINGAGLGDRQSNHDMRTYIDRLVQFITQE